MARKNVLQTQLASAQSLASSFQSKVTFVKFLDNISYQINITTSDSTGTFKIQGSDDYSIDEPTGCVQNAGNWVDLDLSGPNSNIPTISATNDVIGIEVNECPFAALRLSYTSTVAGTGTCNIFITAKQLGG